MSLYNYKFLLYCFLDKYIGDIGSTNEEMKPEFERYNITPTTPEIHFIGSKRHKMGLVITDNNIIITNSGDGVNFHQKEIVKETNSEYKQQKFNLVLKLDKNINHELLRQNLIDLKSSTDNINLVYATIFKYYYSDKIDRLGDDKKNKLYEYIKTNILTKIVNNNDDNIKYSSKVSSNCTYYKKDNNILNFDLIDENKTLKSLFLDILLYEHTYNNDNISVNYLKTSVNTIDETNKHIKFIKELLSIDDNKKFNILYVENPKYLETQYSKSCQFFGIFLAYLYIKYEDNYIENYDRELNELKIKVLNHIINPDKIIYNDINNHMIIELLYKHKNNETEEIQKLIKQLHEIKEKTINTQYKQLKITAVEYNSFNDMELKSINDIIEFIKNNINYINDNIILYEKNILLKIIRCFKDNKINMNNYGIDILAISDFIVNIANNTIQITDINVYYLIIYIIFKLMEKYNILSCNNNINEIKNIYDLLFYDILIEQIKLHIIDNDFEDFINTIDKYQIFIPIENINYIENLLNYIEIDGTDIYTKYNNYTEHNILLKSLINILIKKEKKELFTYYNKMPYDIYITYNSNDILINNNNNHNNFLTVKLDETNFLHKKDNTFDDSLYLKIKYKDFQKNAVEDNSIYISIDTIYKENYKNINFDNKQNVLNFSIVKKTNTKYIHVFFISKHIHKIYDFEKINNLLLDSQYNELNNYMKDFDYSYYLCTNRNISKDDFVYLYNYKYNLYNIKSLIKYYIDSFNKFKEIYEKKTIEDENIKKIYKNFLILFNEINPDDIKKNQLKIDDNIFNIYIKTDDNIIIKYDDTEIIYNNNNNNLYIDKYIIYKIPDLINNNNIFIKNLVYYAKDIINILYIGLDNIDNPKSGILIFSKINNLKNIFTSDDDNKLPKFNFKIKNKQFYYIEFINDYFNSIIPNIENRYSEFLLFTTHLLVNLKYELFNMLLPYIIEADIHLNTGYCNEIIEKKYIPSPYRWYFLNKLHYILNGKYDQNIIFNLCIRKQYYDKNFNDFVIKPNIKLKNFKLEYYDEWIEKYNRIDKQALDRQKLFNIIKNIYQNIKEKSTFNIQLDKIIKHNNLIDYIYANYDDLILYLQYRIIEKIYNILSNKNLQKSEIIGNIKYFIKPTFQKSDKYTDNDINKYVHLFCIITGKILDQIQYETICDLFEDHNTMEYKLYELLMGLGKTYLIIPCIVFIMFMNRDYYNIFICMPTHLINQSLKIFRELSVFFIDGYFFNIDINRKKGITEIFHKHIKTATHKVISLSDISIKSYLLNKKVFEILDDNISLSNIFFPDKEYINREIIKNNPKITDNFNMLNDGSFIIFDEFDMLINPLKSELNYPIEEPKNLAHSYILYNFISIICEKLYKEFKNFLTDSDKPDRNMNMRLIRYIMKSISDTEYIEALQKITNKQFEQFEEDTNFKTNDGYYMVGGSKETLLVYYIKCIYNIFKLCLDMKINLDYGLDKDVYLVIPYSAQNTPLKGSQFSDPIIQMILTYIYFLIKGFRDDDSKKLIGYYIELKKIKGLDSIKENIKEIIIYNRYKNLTTHINNLKKSNDNEYIYYINTYLTKVIFPSYVKVNHEYYNCSFIDIIDNSFIKGKFALSGTVNVHLTDFNSKQYTISKIKNDDITTEEINKALKNTNKDTDQLIIFNYKKPILDFICDLMKDYQVFIDVGSFLRQYNNLEVAKTLFNRCNKSVVYFDDNDKKKIYDNKIKEFTNIKSRLDVIVYFDQKHTIGTDVDIHSEAKSLLSINSNNTYTQVVQGLYRMREINYNQKNNYVIKDIKDVDDIDKIIKYIKDKDEQNFKNTTKNFYKQSLLCLIRKEKEYIKNSYIFKPFIPSETIQEVIYKNLEYDFEKEHFYNYLKELSSISNQKGGKKNKKNKNNYIDMINSMYIFDYLIYKTYYNQQLFKTLTPNKKNYIDMINSMYIFDYLIYNKYYNQKLFKTLTPNETPINPIKQTKIIKEQKTQQIPKKTQQIPIDKTQPIPNKTPPILKETLISNNIIKKQSDNILDLKNIISELLNSFNSEQLKKYLNLYDEITYKQFSIMLQKNTKVEKIIEKAVVYTDYKYYLYYFDHPHNKKYNNYNFNFSDHIRLINKIENIHEYFYIKITDQYNCILLTSVECVIYKQYNKIENLYLLTNNLPSEINKEFKIIYSLAAIYCHIIPDDNIIQLLKSNKIKLDLDILDNEFIYIIDKKSAFYIYINENI